MIGGTGMISSLAAAIGAPFNSKKTAEKERFEALTSGMVLAAIKQLGTNPSNTDLQFVKKAVLEYGKTPEGNRQILDDMDAFMAKKLQEQGIDPAEFMSPPGGDVAARINQRGEELLAQGMPQDQVVEQLRQEFPDGY